MKNVPNKPQSETGSNASEGDVRAALDRMLSHPEFRASQRRREFLNFVVEEALAGRGSALKGFTIAQAVFGRDEGFDPKTDPVVRLEARRLRQDLDSYYVGPGAADPVRFVIPKGGYAPWFEVRPPVPPPETAPDSPGERTDAPPQAQKRGTGRKTAVIATGVAGFAFLALALLSLSWSADVLVEERAAADYPHVAILPFEALESSPTTRTLSMGLSSELVLKLRGFSNLRLFAPATADDLNSNLPLLDGDPVPSYVVRGTVETEGDHVLVYVQLLFSETDEVVWADAYDADLAPVSLVALRDTISSGIATALGQPYGPLSDDVQLRASQSHPESLESYLCVLQAYTYRRSFEREAFEPVRDCLKAAVARSPDYADAWAMLGWLKLDAARYRFVPPDQVEAEYAGALEAAERAYRLAPDNIHAVKALSAVHHHVGNYAEGERFGRIAIDLNPHDPDTLAQVGWRLSVRGKYEEGGPLMEQAILRTIDPPGWYYHLPSLQNFMQGNFERALVQAEIAASKGTGFGQFLVAINSAVTGDADRAAEALKALSKVPSVAEDPADFMRRHGATEAIISAAMTRYREAHRLALGRDGAEPAIQRDE